MNNVRTVKYIPFGEARTSLDEKREYSCQHNWSEKASLQCGSKGVVLKKEGGGYSTAFFEVFYGENFIRGEGETIETAENQAYIQYEKLLNCPQHKFEPEQRNPRNGVCSCCGFIEKNHYLPKDNCCVCGKKHIFLELNEKKYCLNHYIEEAQKIDFTITPEKREELKKNAFNKIIKLRDSDNFMDMMISKDSKNKNIEKFEDVEDNHFYVEMEIEKLKKIKQNLNIFKVIKSSKILDLFEEECILIDLINELKLKSEPASFKYGLTLVNDLIEFYKKEGLINNDLKSINVCDKTTESEVFLELEEYAFYCFFFELIENKYPQIADVDIFEKLYGGLNKKEKLDAIYSRLQVRMLGIINE